MKKIKKERLLNRPLPEVLAECPFLADFLSENHLQERLRANESFSQLLGAVSEEEREEWAIDPERLQDAFYEYFLSMLAFLGLDEETAVEEMTILPGFDKSGQAEGFTGLTLKRGQIVAIVGPTGSGKSRLLADIEWTADGDTPTKRRILINGQPADKKWRLSTSNNLVAQLSQNMNFVMDLSVQEFIELHAASRMAENTAELTQRIFTKANELAGEKFAVDTPVTGLSGGQSRALMIADTAILSQSPIVLIDEIENAGIDRKKALELLVGEEKIVLMATHDPILALMADKRVIISNGGIAGILDTDPAEKALLAKLQKLDQLIFSKREELRYGRRLQDFEI